MCALAIALGAPSAAWAQQARSAWAEGGIGFASVLTSLFYSTAKCLYAGTGALTGILAFALTGGRQDVVQIIINPALRGDYVITPEHLLRQRPLVFIGPYPEDVGDESVPENLPESQGEPRESQPYPF